jgi:hypothetical protein
VVNADWFRFFLSDRKLKFKLKPPNAPKNLFSDWGTLQRGAPQGVCPRDLWFRVFLSDRKLKLKLKPHNVPKNLFSDWGTLQQRAPQGSVLGTHGS